MPCSSTRCPGRPPYVLFTLTAGLPLMGSSSYRNWFPATTHSPPAPPPCAGAAPEGGPTGPGGGHRGAPDPLAPRLGACGRLMEPRARQRGTHTKGGAVGVPRGGRGGPSARRRRPSGGTHTGRSTAGTSRDAARRSARGWSGGEWRGSGIGGGGGGWCGSGGLDKGAEFQSGGGGRLAQGLCGWFC